MKYLAPAAVFAAGYLAACLPQPWAAADPKPAPPPPPANPSIDMPAHIRAVQQAAAHREVRRVTEDEFLRMSREPGAVILDARSKEMFDLLHVKGAVNLSFPDIDTVSLPKVLPDKTARILIYCNNNFTPAPGVTAPGRAAGPNPPAVSRAAAAAFRPKSAPLSLNLSTYTALHNSGYRNVYELAPLIDPAKSKLELVSSAAAK